MARRERPVDPAAGELQSFAYDLRKVRADAGNPTYRVLARTAGYSATTLSEAASGVRRPTLEVVLAYVGACRGDVDEWRRRWLELTDTGSEPAAGPTPAGAMPAVPAQAAATPAGSAEPSAVVPVVPAPRRFRRRTVLIVSSAAAVLSLLVAVAVIAPFGERRTPAQARDAADNRPADPPLTRCPDVPANAAFTGTTYGAGAHVRGGASRDAAVLRTIPTNCTVGFTGFCVGQKISDSTASLPDVRWFKVAGGGVVSSAVVHGNPPQSVKPSSCTDGRPPPSRIVLSVGPDPATPGGLTFDATGDGLDLVGFAASSSADRPRADGTRPWRQITLVETKDARASATKRLDELTAAAASPSTGGGAPGTAAATVIVVAGACFGGDGPTGLVDAKEVRPADPAGRGPAVSDAPALSAPDHAAAARSACQYPSRG
jgi:hypothetical protein